MHELRLVDLFDDLCKPSELDTDDINNALYLIQTDEYILTPYEVQLICEWRYADNHTLLRAEARARQSLVQQIPICIKALVKYSLIGSVPSDGSRGTSSVPWLSDHTSQYHNQFRKC